MEEPTTHRTILRLGCQRFGRPTAAQEAALAERTDRARTDARTRDELLAGAP